MKKILLYILSVLFLVSCQEHEILDDTVSPNAVELEGIEAEVSGGAVTRAIALDANNYVGRNVFVDKDQMVLTTIKRTAQTIAGFNYSGIVYNHAVESGQTSGGWNRDKSKGRTEASEVSPERIYWSDAVNPHTYIGYSLPQQPSSPSGETEGGFDWNLKNSAYAGSGTDGIPMYYGSLGDPTQPQTSTVVEGKTVVSNYIDYTNDAGDVEVADVDETGKVLTTKSYKSGNNKIKRDDLLLTWDDQKVAETGGSVAKLYFHHALAMVRVVVNIQGFSASTDAADSKSVVSGMVLKNMRTLYKWRQQGYGAEALDPTYDTNNINAIYGNTVTCDQRKDVHLWIPRPLGTGTGVGKQFTFYGLAVPCSMGVNSASTPEQQAQNLHFDFQVKYPDPMNPDVDVVRTYNAMMPNAIEFRAGHCTTINISLNHSNEEMTVGAEYMDWQYVETPDQGELKKNSNFLTYIPTDDADRIAKKIYIADDIQATEDDALWLYKNSAGKIVDIYGNDGTLAQPYTICTADQLLSFAYEVKKGRSFVGQYVKLDADIIMQPSVEMKYDEGGFYTTITTDEETNQTTKNYGTTTGVTWIGIGDDTHEFKGTFDGGGRNISFIKGAPLFYKLGKLSVVDKVNLSNILQIDGNGAIANENFEGLICCCHIDGNIKGNASSSGYWGSIVGTNSKGLIVGCSHVGKVIGNASATAVSGLVGYNSGSIIACYHSGLVTGDADKTYAAIGSYDVNSYAISCYFNQDENVHDYDNLASLIPHVAFPLTTDAMQKEKFVNSSEYIYNDGHTHTNWYEQHYSLNKALEAFVEKLAAVEVPSSSYATFLTLTLTSGGKQKFLSHFATSADGGITWTLRDDHKYVYTPAAYPLVK